MVCVGVLVGKEGVCQKSLPLTEGMIHSREREAAQAKEREKTAERERERERENEAEMLIRKNKPRMLI